jgi:4'-phosphopantetheinyl transferase
MNNTRQLLETKVKLSSEEIHVFSLQLSSLDYDEFFPYLSEDENERASKLKIEHKKKQFVIARGMLRNLLSNILGKVAAEIKFSYGEHKKPYIEEQYNDNSVEFNISHSGDFVLIAMTLGNKIGVDIEQINQKIDFKSLSDRIFSQKEKEELENLSENEQLHAFYRAWVRKESFIKATGKGIAFGLDKFSVSLNENKISRIETIPNDLIKEQWYCYDLMNIDNYKTALTCCRKEQNIIFCQ